MPGFLICEQHVVHLPEPSLHTGSLSRTRSGECMRMCGNEGVLAEDHTQTRTKLLLHVFQNGIKQTARRTLKVAKLLERDRCISGSNAVGRLGPCFRDIDGSGRLGVRLNRSVSDTGRWSRWGRRISRTRQIPTRSESDAENGEDDY